MYEYKLFIDGNWVDGFSNNTIDVIDPSTEEVIGKVVRGSSQDINRAVEAARRAYEHEWRDKKPKDRARLLFNLARALEGKADHFAEVEAKDSGKPISRALAEIMSTARYFEFYAGAADKYYGDTIPLGPDYIDFTLREPMGVTAHIVPWNFPLNMIGRSVAPALAMGNTAVVKPAEDTPLTALMLADLMTECGFPAGVYNVVTGYGEEAGAPLSSHPGVDSITFTGSVETGRKIMQAASIHIKPLVLELGGKSPHIVFADTDLDLAIEEVAKGIFSNTGQVCSAGSRLVVQRKIKDEMIERLAQYAEKITLGPALDDPQMGPLVSKVHLERVKKYVGIGIEEGATIVTGAKQPSELKKGYFYSPTIFDDTNEKMRIVNEEIFGPVLIVQTFDELDEALAISNNVSFGLVAGIFTNDLNKAMYLISKLHVGQVYVNEYFAGGEETPFGGYKGSGFGREKGIEALQNYTQVKNVAIRIRRPDKN